MFLDMVNIERNARENNLGCR